jgi:16S rRNA (guanine(966)-N(2))-methyltransferase RsmD
MGAGGSRHAPTRGLRIIAGTLRGRRLRIPQSSAVRPTAERVREALFSILGDRVVEARVLELYCGSGALGFEALSRGAREIVFVDSSPAVIRLLLDNAARLGVEARIHAVRGAARELVQRGGVPGRFDLVLADPPYADEESRLLPALRAAGGLLSDGGWLVLERETTVSPVERPDPGLRRFRSARYGRTSLDFYERSRGG